MSHDLCIAKYIEKFVKKLEKLVVEAKLLKKSFQFQYFNSLKIENSLKNGLLYAKQDDNWEYHKGVFVVVAKEDSRQLVDLSGSINLVEN